MKREQSDILIGPYEFAVDVTNKCNYRCKHCYNSSGENSVIDEEMSDAEFIDFINDIAKVNLYNICFCGGEPLLRLDLVIEAAKILSNNGVPFISLVSNGYYWNDDVAKRIKDAGINRIQISLDGASEESCYKLRGNKRAFDKAINALKLLKKHNFEETNIAFCPTKFNIDEFEDVCEICYKLNVNLIRVQPLMLSGRASEFRDELELDKEGYIKLLRTIDKMNIKYAGKLQINWGDPLDHLYRYSQDESIYSTFASVKANGNILISPYIPLSVGNIKKHKFSEYWNKGLPKTWRLDISKKMVSNVLCIEDMGKHFNGDIEVWKDKDVSIDIIDNNYNI